LEYSLLLKNVGQSYDVVAYRFKWPSSICSPPSKNRLIWQASAIPFGYRRPESIVQPKRIPDASLEITMHFWIS